VSNAFYAGGAEAILNGQIDWTADNVYWDLLLATYVPDLINHRFYSDIAAFAVFANRSRFAIQTKDTAAGVASGVFAFNPVSVPAGPSIGYFVIYDHLGQDSISPLIALYDTGVGLPFTPDGTTCTFGYTGSGWFQI
jgi:hypothetical protein